MSDLSWDRIKAAFEAALGASDSDRAGVLDRLCAGDVPLRREVESLLQARTRDLVGTGAAGRMMQSLPTASGVFSPITERAGETIGAYRLLQLIGEGGFGTVFLAEQTEPVRRRVALKIIKLGMDTRQVVARFEAERQALALMDHPNIARVYDGGATATGRPFFVMEYVVGDAITAFAAAKRLGVRERLDLFMQVCRAVQHAHTKGVIHRDLKPANVLVSVVDGRPLAKVIDFGIAKATGALAGLGGVLTPKTLFTEHGQLIGTPEYMSPEQAEGSPDIDTRTDVYALGVMLYELLTGLTPFDAKRLRSAGWVGMQKIIRDEEPAAPSVRLKRVLQGPESTLPAALVHTAASAPNEPDAQARVTPSPCGHAPASLARAPGSLAGISPEQVKGELDWIVMKALDKDRARRYETPGAIADDVGRHLAGEAVAAAPAGRVYRVRKFVRRNKGAVGAGVAVAAALVLGMAGTTLGLYHAREKEREVASLIDRARAELAFTVMTKHANGGEWEATEEIRDLVDPDRIIATIRTTARQGPNTAITYTTYIFDESGKELEGPEAVSILGLAAQNAVDAAEWSAYTANLALAQAALAANNYPEARRTLERIPADKRGWEWQFLTSSALANVWSDREPGAAHSISFNEDGTLLVLTEPTGRVLEVRNSTTGQFFESADSPQAHRFAGELGPAGELELKAVGSEEWSGPAKWLGRKLTWTEWWRSPLVTFSADGKLVAWIGQNRGEEGLPALRVARVDQWGGPVRELPQVGIPIAIWDPDLEADMILGPVDSTQQQGLELITPNRSRRIVGAADRTVRFFDVKTAREVAVFRVPDAVRYLQMGGAGDQLVITLWNETLLVWDIRDPSERKKDIVREWSERVPAGAYVQKLLDGEMPTAQLYGAIANDPSLTALRRLVAVRVLNERLADLGREADEAFKKLATGQTDKAALEAAAANLPARVRKMVRERARSAEADEILVQATAQKDWPVGMQQRVEWAVEARTELLGRTHVSTLQAREVLSRALPEGERARCRAELIFREGTDLTSALRLIETAIAAEDDKRPTDVVHLAMIHFWLAAPLVGTDDDAAVASRQEHVTKARAALVQARAMMTDPKYKAWATDDFAKALLAEAEALIK